MHLHHSRVLPRPSELDFDPDNREHIEAAMMLLLQNRQHPTLRFRAKYPFVSVRETILITLAVRYAEMRTGNEYKMDSMFPGEGINRIVESILHPANAPAIGGGVGAEFGLPAAA